jgi:hypothetical protein
MYKKKPIYWLFTSNPSAPQKAAFRVLVYMHRMDRYTLQHIRTKYLHPQQEYLRSAYLSLEANEANLSNAEKRQMDTIARYEIECREYDDKLKNLANEQITFDLDNGVAENYKIFEGVVAEIK